MIIFIIFTIVCTLSALAVIICALALYDSEKKKSAPPPSDNFKKIDGDLEAIAAMLNYLTERGFSPETSARIINLATVNKNIHPEKRNKYNLLMNRILQYSVKHGS